MNKPSVVHSHPEIVSGEPVFVGTRVPVRNLLDWLEGGHTLDDFLDNFPTVKREQAIAFLEEAAAALLSRPYVSALRKAVARVEPGHVLYIGR